ncbi:MAG: tetratricopeptide repeat protein [Burkholderiales bacterium]|nr:tetratricopeptide repeat protein [Burkholderiales bacterium]
MKPSKTSLQAACALAVALLVGSAAHAQPAPAASAPPMTVRPEVGKPLQEVQALFKDKKYAEALVKIKEAEAVPNLTPYEKMVTDRMHGVAASGVGDDATAVKSFDAAIASGLLKPDEEVQLVDAVARSAFRAKDYKRSADAANREIELGGKDAQMPEIRIKAYYLANDYAAVVRYARPDFDAAEAAGRPTEESMLRVLASSYNKLGDDAGYAHALELLLAHYPTADYWLDRLARLANQSGFAEALMLDVYRLKTATGTMTDTDDFVQAAQMSLAGGLPIEARSFIEAGYASGKLGTGAGAPNQKKLRDSITRAAAEDEKAIATGSVAGRKAQSQFDTGHEMVMAGKFDAGIAAMEQAIAQGGLKQPQWARLHLGEAYYAAGNKAKAIETFKAVGGTDGAADLARLWAIHAAYVKPAAAPAKG